MPRSADAITDEDRARGARFKELRKRLNLTQPQVFKDHAQVSSVESGRNKVTGSDLLVGLAIGFGLSPSDMVAFRDGKLSVEQAFQVSSKRLTKSEFSGNRVRVPADESLVKETTERRVVETQDRYEAAANVRAALLRRGRDTREEIDVALNAVMFDEGKWGSTEADLFAAVDDALRRVKRPEKAITGTRVEEEEAPRRRKRR